MTVKFWTVEELSQFLGVPKSWIYERTRKRGAESIPHHRFGKYVRFDPASPEFRDWLQSCCKGGGGGKGCEAVRTRL